MLSHSYVVLGSYEMVSGDQTIQILQLRDPWELESQYTGPWNVNDEAWTTDLAAQVPYQTSDLSLFFMDIETFVLAFRRYAVAYMEDDYVMSYMELLENDRSPKVYSYTLESGQSSMFVAVDIMSSHLFPCQEGYSYVWMSIKDASGMVVDTREGWPNLIGNIFV